MKEKELKNRTADLINVMIQNADKGLSGFWTDDYEGCGNPNIFPEFEEGLKHGKYVRKDHSFCPWNAAILYGDGHGNVTSGCYYSCSIRDAVYLSAEMLKAVLTRFNKRLKAGSYDDTEHIRPLLTEGERSYIEKQKILERQKQEHQWQKDKDIRIKKASALIQKYQGNEDLKALLAAHYGDDIMVRSQFGCIDFSLSGKRGIVGGEKLTYDEYVEIQIQSFGKQRSWFEMCYYNIPNEFIGCIGRKTKDKICFKRIYVSGMYSDGCDFFEGKEDHVWMDNQGFENFGIGDNVSFFAEVYRYIKTGNRKYLDYSLRKPQSIKQVSSYQLPREEDIIRQGINQIICETCYLSEQCSKMSCLRNRKEIQILKKQMYGMVRANINDNG